MVEGRKSGGDSLLPDGGVGQGRWLGRGAEGARARGQCDGSDRRSNPFPFVLPFPCQGGSLSVYFYPTSVTMAA